MILIITVNLFLFSPTELILGKTNNIPFSQSL